MRAETRTAMCSEEHSVIGMIPQPRSSTALCQSSWTTQILISNAAVVFGPLSLAQQCGEVISRVGKHPA
jgi:hypothetical protein